MDTSLYCGKCKIATPTTDYNIIDHDVNRKKKSGEESTTKRKIIKGSCEICKAKKHIFANKEGKIKIPVIKEQEKDDDDFTEEEIRILKAKGYSKLL
jgi:hypothetical protein